MIDPNSTEVRRVIEYLGLSSAKGEVKDTHLGKILNYIISNPHGDYEKMLSILALKCQMQKRYIRENTLDGLEYMKIINVNHTALSKEYEYLGIPESTTSENIEEKAPEYKKAKEEQEKEKLAELQKQAYNSYLEASPNNKDSYDEWLHKHYKKKGVLKP